MLRKKSDSDNAKDFSIESHLFNLDVMIETVFSSTELKPMEKLEHLVQLESDKIFYCALKDALEKTIEEVEDTNA